MEIGPKTGYKMSLKHKKIILVSLAALFVLGIGFYFCGNYLANKYMVWKVSVNSGYGYFIPKESSAWKFKPLVLSEGSGENWIYGEDDRYYYYAGDGISPEEYIKTEKSLSNCSGFNPRDYKTWCDWQKITDIDQKVQMIDQEKNYQIRKLSGEKFLDHAYDGGGELTGYFKDGKIQKIVEQVGISTAMITYEYYFSNDELILVHEKEEDYQFAEGTMVFNYTKTDLVFEGSYYFYNEKIFHTETAGERRWTKETEFVTRVKRYTPLLSHALADCFVGNISELESDVVKSITDENLKKLILDSLQDIYLNALKDRDLPAGDYCKVIVSSAKVDLNSDGVSEYIVVPGEYYDQNYASIYIGGVHANAPITVFGIINGKWTVIGEMAGQLMEKIPSHQSGGYPNLVTYGSNGASSGVYNEYTWDGKVYKFFKRTPVEGDIIGPYKEVERLWGW